MTDTPTDRDSEGGWVKLRRRKLVQWAGRLQVQTRRGQSREVTFSTRSLI